jgi:hypothetical protein
MMESDGDFEDKLALIRKAAGNRTGGREVDIETMLAETEAARLAEIEAGMDSIAAIRRLPATPGG